ncbi:polyprenol reductase [Toxorhynchites rutilus septentrionalis]|uniref:polyprenol reductase n=1 Tax=Toxorhynchites rutilus septentrionalis TaxID=329112 RepID=UPI00247940B5|nr:polyprenol reductase [Toxorhynchites rutilus septentrionalis]XP_055626160.1 polyprenol reductase [Toxorhynchites rutilus septentrionalis]XP_055626161.1 polyprenol reductase [Toxorhynchites rutilus septentrionalis]XP_055626162.1 polyprenol reductase [Toxorhynchites rutilus septentrionalis]
MLSSLLDLHSINLINFLFVQLVVIIVVLGSLIATIERYLPTAVCQTFRYGKHAHKGPQDRLISLLEVPKSWFKHFYVFAAAWSTAAFYLMLNAYFAGNVTPSYVIDFLDIMGTTKRTVKTTPTETMVAITLLTIQCWRRFYETFFVQVFSSKLKMNLSAYLVGYIHYFGSVVVILSQAEGFVRTDGSLLPYRFELSPRIACWIAVFVYAWRYQFQSNLILASLRKDRSGNVITQKHSVPKGGYFELVSSPHMFFEIVMYTALYAIIARNTSAAYVLVWVISNQTMNSWLTHQWYRENFKDYPSTRRALIPYVL